MYIDYSFVSTQVGFVLKLRHFQTFFFIPVRLRDLRHGLWEPLYEWDNKTIFIYARSAIIYNDLATIIKTPVAVLGTFSEQEKFVKISRIRFEYYLLLRCYSSTYK